MNKFYFLLSLLLVSCAQTQSDKKREMSVTSSAPVEFKMLTNNDVLEVKSTPFVMSINEEKLDVELISENPDIPLKMVVEETEKGVTNAVLIANGNQILLSIDGENMSTRPM